MHIPEHVSWDEAATVGVAIGTVGLALYKFLGLPLPGSEKPASISHDAAPILIYGGSTATGSIAIQFAKLYVWCTTLA
jgi:NADPH:quinone reductase-like Zn-dependent oxidoreductase